jgi:hypothetical protein
MLVSAQSIAFANKYGKKYLGAALLSKIFLSDTLFYALKKFDMKNIDLFYSH